MQTLAAWLGNTDVQGAKNDGGALSGPIAQALSVENYDRLLLLSNQPDLDLLKYEEWLRSWLDIEIVSRTIPLSDPTDFREIYLATTEFLDANISITETPGALTFHLSPGTPAMAAIWLLLATTRYTARMIQSSKEHSVREAEVPFEISIEYVPRVVEAADRKLRQDIAEIPPEGAVFGDIYYKSAPMAKVISLAKRAASRELPVLIDGETGTGKELLARAIHNDSPRSDCPFVAINCGAIPRDLVESEMFGTSKGSFSNAVDRPGHFESANNGTIFLDEIADLPLESQVKLLRVLEEGEVTRIGESNARLVNVRIIAASHRNLIQAVRKREFREDLLYRLLGVMLTLPPLRDRPGDIGFLADRLLQKINETASRSQLQYVTKRLSPAARNALVNYDWPGNVRELVSTLRRAALWSDDEVLDEQDIGRAIIPNVIDDASSETILNRPIGNGFQISAVQELVTKHYLLRAVRESQGNKSEAARLLGLPNYQTVNNWLKKYAIDA